MSLTRAFVSLRVCVRASAHACARTRLCMSVICEAVGGFGPLQSPWMKSGLLRIVGALTFETCRGEDGGFGFVRRHRLSCFEQPP